MHRFFHTIVIVGAGVSSGCGESHENVEADSGVSKDASQDSQVLADRVIEDANKMRDASPDAERDRCPWYNPPDDAGWEEDACPLIR